MKLTKTRKELRKELDYCFQDLANVSGELRNPIEKKIYEINQEILKLIQIEEGKE